MIFFNRRYNKMQVKEKKPTALLYSQNLLPEAQKLFFFALPAFFFGKFKFSTGIGQESKSLHKSSLLILTLSRLFSFPRVIKNSKRVVTTLIF